MNNLEFKEYISVINDYPDEDKIILKKFLSKLCLCKTSMGGDMMIIKVGPYKFSNAFNFRRVADELLRLYKIDGIFITNCLSCNKLIYVFK